MPGLPHYKDMDIDHVSTLDASDPATSVDECPVCGAPLRVYEDFCSRDCWDSWHYVNDPETWREANHR